MKWFKAKRPYLSQISNRLLLMSISVSVVIYILESIHLVSMVWGYVLGLILVLLFVLFLMNVKVIKKFLVSNIRFTMLISGFLSFSIVYLVAFILLAYGSPFVYEDPLSISGKSNFETPEPGMMISRDIHAYLNNFGTVNIALKPIVDDEINVSKLRGGQKIIFQISEKGNEPFYKTNYDLIWHGNQVFIHPFGFPVQENSKNKVYTVSFIFHEQDNSYKLAIAGDLDSLSDNERLLLSSRYVFPVAWARENISDAVSVLFLKSKGVLSDQLVTFSLLFALLILSIIRIVINNNLHL